MREQLEQADIIGTPTLDEALAVLGQLAAGAEARGERNLIFCEDRLTLLAERAVLAELGGTFCTEVTTFARFLSGGAQVLSKQGSVMLMSALVTRYEDELHCFNRGSAEAVYETVAQLSASRVDAALLRAGAEETDGLLKSKLSDLAFLLDKYTQALQEKGLVDENGYLALLPQKLAEADLQNTNVIFFAFPSFTRQAQEGVRAALRHAKRVKGVFLSGRADFYTNESARIFRKIYEEELPQPRRLMLKSTLAGEAAVLAEGVFSPEAFSKAAPVATDKVHLFTAADEEEELRRVAAYIRALTARGLRFRDIAVLVPDEQSFYTVEKVFASYKIPYFADQKRAFSEHPFCMFALDVLDAVSDGVLADEADSVASSVYFGDGAAYRNYLAKYGAYRGAVRREIKENVVGAGELNGLRAARERMISALDCFPKKGKGSAFVAGVKKLKELFDLGVTEALAEQFSGSEKEFLSLTPLDGVLSETEALAGERTFTSREFAAMFKSGLEALKVSMIPNRSDAVFVGDCTESKFARVKVLFATGLTDGVPRVSADTAVIGDRDIRRLSQLQVQIEPAIEQVNARARESLALNLSAFEEQLFLSCSVRRGGEEVSEGEVLRYAARLFACAMAPDPFPYDCCEAQPALLRMLSTEDDRLRSALYELLNEREEDVARKVMQPKEPKISCGEQLYFSGGSVSPTLLEQYFACPYAGFLSRGLRLREREEGAMMDTDAGTFVHAVLERVAEKLNGFDSEEACKKCAAQIAEELLGTPRFAALRDTGAGEYKSERLIGESADISAVMFRQLAGSAFRVKETEGDIALPALSLRGKSDRVDEAGEYVRVIDYKTGNIDGSATSYYTGKKLQLQLYLRAAAQGKKAAGAFYFPAAEAFTKPDEVKFRMTGFYNGEDDVLLLHDTSLKEGEKSLLFEGTRNGKLTDKGMSGEDFERFLDYALLVSAKAEGEMKAGNIAPSPYEEACEYCKMKGMCNFEGRPRKESAVKCGDIVRIVKREKGEA